MKKSIIIILLSSFSYSQTISKQVIGTGGNNYSNSNFKLSYTIGEPVVGVMTGGGNQLGNGYYPALNLQVLSIEDNTLDLQLIVFPNPTSQLLYVTHPDINSFAINIVDLNGKLIYSGAINKDEPKDVSNYTQGIYLVTVENKESSKKNTYKIIKK